MKGILVGTVRSFILNIPNTQENNSRKETTMTEYNIRFKIAVLELEHSSNILNANTKTPNIYINK